MEKTKLQFMVNDHFDLMWRRCADRPLLFQGQSFVPYADLEAYYIEDNLALCRDFPFYAFQVESVAVLRKYLRHHQEREGEIKALAAAGRLTMPFSGDNIIDTNMTQCESIIRNYLYGILWQRQTLGLDPKACDRADAFGNSAQLPQILRKFGVRWVYALHYTTPGQSVYWRGLDGSTIVCRSGDSFAGCGGWGKWKPCPACHGFKKTAAGEACPVCGGRGIDFESMKGRMDQSFTLRRDKMHTDGYPNAVSVGSEEGVPPRFIPEWCVAHADEFDCSFSNEEQVFAEMNRPYLDRVDDPDPALIYPSPELNPNNTGVYVTRIRAKQRTRHMENAVAAAEFLSLAAAQRGAAYPYRTLSEVWERIHFSMFHDAITGTHVDAAFEELMDSDDRAETAIAALSASAAAALTEKADGKTLVNPTCGTLYTEVDGHPVSAAPFSAVHVTPTPAAAVTREEVPEVTTAVYTIENERYRVSADAHGLTEIFDKQLGRTVSSAGAYRPGELVAEHDEGSPWCTLSGDRRRVCHARHTHLRAVERSEERECLVFRMEGGIHAGYGTESIQSDLTVTLTRGCPRVDFHLHTTWETFNYRLRIAFPTAMTGRAVYEIPGGLLERQPYDFAFDATRGESAWAAAAGDWPAIHFAGIGGADGAAAVFNRGTPSYLAEAAEDGTQTLFLTVLRSPYNPTYLHEPTNYVMTDWNGMTDHGVHDFDYAFVTYGEDFDKNDCVRDAIAYNAVPFVAIGALTLPSLPAVSAGAQVLGLKAAEDGRGMILHLAEQHGLEADVTVTLPAPYTQAENCLLDETPGEALPVRDGKVTLPQRKFGITALRLY